MDFGTWSILVSEISAKSYASVAALKAAILASWSTFSEYIVRRSCHSVTSRLEAMIKTKGGYFEIWLLQYIGNIYLNLCSKFQNASLNRFWIIFKNQWVILYGMWMNEKFTYSWSEYMYIYILYNHESKTNIKHVKTTTTKKYFHNEVQNLTYCFKCGKINNLPMT